MTLREPGRKREKGSFCTFPGPEGGLPELYQQKYLEPQEHPLAEIWRTDPPAVIRELDRLRTGL